MSDLSKLRISGTDYNLKDAQARSDITALNGSLAHLEEGGLNIKDEVIEADITAWLEEHPEATTTVQDGAITAAKLQDGAITAAKLQDGAITAAKLDASLKAKSNTVLANFAAFAESINDGNNSVAYTGGSINVASTIQITAKDQCLYKSYANITFILNANMFDSALPYFDIPNFVNCTFIGNGYAICADNAYVLRGKFVNCNFVDCSLVRNGYFVQSTRFLHCTIANTSETTFIHAKRIYDVKFISCQCERENEATLIDAYGTDKDVVALGTIVFSCCILESQKKEILIGRDLSVCIENCYTENNSAPFIKALASNFQSNGIVGIVIKNTRIQPTSGINFVELDESYNNSTRASFTCYNCSVAVGNLINTNNLRVFDLRNVSVSVNGKVKESNELSRVESYNSVADFRTPGHIIVKKFPVLITFDSNDGGKYHTNLYLVSLSHYNTPSVVCLSDPTKTPTCVYDAETGYVDVTKHVEGSTPLANKSAVLLNGVTNNLVRNNYYRSTDGY